MTISGNSDEAKSEGYVSVGVIDDRKRRRMESNRESARRSRQKKQQHLDELLNQLGTLKRQNDEFAKKINEITAGFSDMEAKNAVLNAEKDRLATRLESLESIIDVATVVKGSSSSSEIGNGNGIGNDDLMMEPWLLPSYSLPITASSSGFRCFNYFDA